MSIVAEIIGSSLRRHVAMAIFRHIENGMDDVVLVIRAVISACVGQSDKLMTSGPGLSA